MPTVQEIITFADRKYPNQETNANKIIDIDGIHKRIFVKIEMLKGKYKTSTDATEADQLTYSLPSDCMIDNIATILVSDDSAEEWYAFDYAGLNDDVSSGRWWGKAEEGYYSLVEDGEPITTTDRGIIIYYYKTPATISATTDTPELEAFYHDLLKYALIQSLASQGHNPDTDIANYWQKEYDVFMEDVEKNLSNKYNKTPVQSNQIQECW